MSANPADEALARLNYFNGQRLAATDFRAEQGHHTGMRRVLNHALYSPGIVTGMEVEPDPNNSHRLVVRRGLAFDHLGREIFLPGEQIVQAMGAPSTTKGIVFGNLLVVSYREQRKHPVSDGCAVSIPCSPCGGDLPWGAPSRIVAEAVFEFLDSWPSDDSGKVVLAQIELSKTCEVVRVLPGVRQYAIPVKPQTVRPVSLEGEKDIDQANPKVLYFHIQGGYAEAIILYLRSRKFPSLYYTEVGKHTPTLSHALGSDTHDFSHSHTVTGGKTTLDGDHKHKVLVNDPSPSCLDDETNDDVWWVDNVVSTKGEHEHNLKDVTLSSDLGVYTHSHTLAVSAARLGVSDTEVRKPVAPAVDTFALNLLLDLRVSFDGTDITDRILDQLRAKPGQAANWPALGDTAGNLLASTDGTSEIDLLRIPGIEIGPGRHTLMFRVDKPAVGGTLQYNLYVS